MLGLGLYLRTFQEEGNVSYFQSREPKNNYNFTSESYIGNLSLQTWTKSTQDLPSFHTGDDSWKVNIKTFIPLACAECDNSLPFSGASSIPVCYVLFPATRLHQLFLHSLSPYLAIYFLVYLSTLFPNSYIIAFRKFYFLPFSVHAQTNVIYLNLLYLL